MSVLILCGILLLAAARTGHSRPGGPPSASACTDLMPIHGPPSQSGIGGYAIATTVPVSGNAYQYAAGVTYTITITGTGVTFRGWIVQAVTAGTRTGIGSFQADTNQKQQLYTSCSPYTVTHNQPIVMDQRIDYPIQTYMWTAPSGSGGMVDFRFTIVQRMPIFYADLNAIAVNLLAPPVTTESTPAPTRPPLPSNALAPSRAPADYRLIYRDPEGCNNSDCNIFVGIDTNTNEDFLDFYIEGQSRSWVAVGFSPSSSMVNADVFVCAVNPSNGDMVEVLDTWNIPDFRTNRVDALQDTYLFSGEFTDGRIKCSFTRSILGSSAQDLDLNNDYYVLYGVGPTSPLSDPSAFIGMHSLGGGIPSISAEQANPVTQSGEGRVNSFLAIHRPRLIRAHGILMLIAWPVLAATAILFASRMRSALPNGEWFQVHRALMICSLFLGALGFILIFVASAKNPTPGLISLGRGNGLRTAHFVFGLTVMLLQIINPIIAIFRCHPGEKNRWIFNLFHGRVIGLIAITFAIANCSMGLWIFSQDFSIFSSRDGLRYATIFWVFLAYTLFDFVVAVIMGIYFYIRCAKSKKEGCKGDKDNIQLTAVHNKEKESIELGSSVATSSPEEEGKKKPSADAPCRWGTVAFFWFYMFSFILAVIVMVALLPMD